MRNFQLYLVLDYFFSEEDPKLDDSVCSSKSQSNDSNKLKQATIETNSNEFLTAAQIASGKIETREDEDTSTIVDSETHTRRTSSTNSTVKAQQMGRETFFK